MKITTITNGIKKIAGRSGLLLKKHSPEILLVVGVAGGVTATILACRATLRVDGVIASYKVKKEKVDECWEKVAEGEIALDDYSELDHKKDLTLITVQTAADFIKLYGPAVTLGAVSIFCIICSHGIMKKRNVALMAAYKAVEEGFTAYRKRVIEEHGEEADYMYKNNLKYEQITETEVNEDGKTKKVKKNVMTNIEDQPEHSMYARFFDETAKQWQKNAEYNFLFLRSQQNYFNEMLLIRGHVFLNEVYDALGIERTSYGSVVGWVLNKDGDNFIDFGIFDGKTPAARAFVNRNERSILLDFNVDGIIYDKI